MDIEQQPGQRRHAIVTTYDAEEDAQLVLSIRPNALLLGYYLSQRLAGHWLRNEAGFPHSLELSNWELWLVSRGLRQRIMDGDFNRTTLQMSGIVDSYRQQKRRQP